jgi:hypothetical protein
MGGKKSKTIAKDGQESESKFECSSNIMEIGASADARKRESQQTQREKLNDRKDESQRLG